MWTDEVRVLDDVSPAQWLESRITGPAGTVTGVVPAGYPAYARVLHPVVTHDGVTAPMTWTHVADALGRAVVPTVRWHELIGAPDRWTRTSAVWSGERPEWGNLALAQLEALCESLTAHTGTAQDCLFALWEGWAQLTGGPARAWLTADGGVPAQPLLDEEESAAPRLELPGRGHVLLQGPLSSVSALAQYDGPHSWLTQSPSLFWPADRAWCVATDIDLDSTLVGGSEEAVDAVLSTPALEAFRVRAEDTLL